MVTKDEHYRGLAAMYAAAPTNQAYRDLSIDVTEGAATISVQATQQLHHAGHAVHGSHYFKLLDDAAYFAVNSLVTDVFVLTAQFSVQLFRPVASGKLRAEGRVTRFGRRLSCAEAVLYDDQGRELARGHGSFARSENALLDLEPYSRGAGG